MKRTGLLACMLRLTLPLAVAAAPAPAVAQTADGLPALQQRLANQPPRDPGSLAYARGDYAGAIRLWHAAAQRGDPVAQYNLGLMYAFGLGVDEDPRVAASWYRKSAEQGYHLAQAVLGLFYASGVGVPMDTREAVRWWKLAAAQGNADARFNLGMSYWSGDGVPQDFDAAAEQFRKSVPAGSAWGRTVLGTRSLGVAPGNDRQQPPAQAGAPAEASPDSHAASAFRRTLDAAEAGDPVSQAQLGYLYAVGHGVRQNLSEAYMWNNLAAARLPPGPVRDTAVQNRNAAAASISADDILRAQERSRAWMAVFDGRR